MHDFDESIKELILDLCDAEAIIAQQKADKALCDRVIVEQTAKVEATKGKIQDLMNENGVTRTETEYQCISLRNNPIKVVITNEELLPEEFLRIKKEPDRLYIKRILEDGIPVPGAMLGNGGVSLMIRTKE